MTNPDEVTLELVEKAREFLAVAHEGAKKPLVAVDIRTGNIGRQGVMWVETTTALAGIEAAATLLVKLREALEAIIRLNDLNGYDEGDLEAVARNHLAECENIASAALSHSSTTTGEG